MKKEEMNNNNNIIEVETFKRRRLNETNVEEKVLLEEKNSEKAKKRNSLSKGIKGIRKNKKSYSRLKKSNQTLNIEHPALSQIFKLLIKALSLKLWKFSQLIFKGLIKVIKNIVRSVFSYFYRLSQTREGKKATALIITLSIGLSSTGFFAIVKANENNEIKIQLQGQEALLDEKDKALSERQKAIEKTQQLVKKIQDATGVTIVEETQEENVIVDQTFVNTIANQVVKEMNLAPREANVPKGNIHAILPDDVKEKAMERVDELVKAANIPTKTEYYDLSDWRKLSHLTAEQYNQMLKGTSTAEDKEKGVGLEGLGYLFVEFEQKYQINGFITMCMIGLESSWGLSEYAKTYYNYGGIGATDIDTDKNVNKTARNRTEGIEQVFKKLKTEYLSKDGIWHRGYGVKDVNKKWCSQIDWYLKIIRIANERIQML